MSEIAHLSREQARRVDEIASSVFKMPSILLMENAARSAGVAASRLLRDRSGEVLILVGPGNNGGDGLALARFLANAGREVTLATLYTAKPSAPDAAVMHDIAVAMGLPFEPASPGLLARPVALVIDAMFGTGLARPLEGAAAEIARATAVLREQRPDTPVLALDLPSGLDADTGEPVGGPAAACVVATHTVTFAAPKKAFLNADSEPYTGEIAVADIGCPPKAIELAISR